VPKTRRERWRGWRTALGGVAILLVLLGAVVALGILRVRSVEGDLRTARDLITTASEHLEQGRLADARTALAAASDHLSDASADLHNHAELGLLELLPVASENLEALREVVTVASRLSVGGERLLAAAAPLESATGDLEVPLADGAIPLEAVEAARREAAQLVTALPPRVSDASSRLLDRVEDLRTTVLEEAVRRRSQLDVLSRGLTLVGDMSGGSGERHYLIAVANTAEMRGSGGMILSYGALVGRDGDFELRSFGRIDELVLDRPVDRDAVPTIPDDYLERWRGFDPLLRWRNANLAADFELTAPALEVMYWAATGVIPSGVIQVDPQGLAAILRGTGPVEVPELGTVTADNVVDVVLSQAYARFPDIDSRSDVLGDVAEATFQRLVTGRYPSLRPLADALLAAVDGRHVLMHSVSSRAQEQVAHFGAAGALPPLGSDAMSLTVQNVSANKLDYYVDTNLAVTGERPEGAFGRVEVEVTVANTAPVGVSEPRYVFGPFNADQQVGLYRGAVSVYLPVGATLLGAEGDSVAAPVLQSEAGRPVIGFNVDVPAGGSRTVVLELQLAPRPSGDYELLLVPSPRVRPTHVRVALEGADVDADLLLDRTWRLRSGEEPAPVRGALG
jgi:hypothetical protein